MKLSCRRYGLNQSQGVPYLQTGQNTLRNMSVINRCLIRMIGKLYHSIQFDYGHPWLRISFVVFDCSKRNAYLAIVEAFADDRSLARSDDAIVYPLNHSCLLCVLITICFLANIWQYTAWCLAFLCVFFLWSRALVLFQSFWVSFVQFSQS